MTKTTRIMTYFWKKVTKRITVLLLKIGILRQRTRKTKPVRETYDFYKIIEVIKYRVKTKVRISQNDHKESCSVF